MPTSVDQGREFKTTTVDLSDAVVGLRCGAVGGAITARAFRGRGTVELRCTSHGVWSFDLECALGESFAAPIGRCRDLSLPPFGWGTKLSGEVGRTSVVLEAREWVLAALVGRMPLRLGAIPSWPYPDSSARASRICQVISGSKSSSRLLALPRPPAPAPESPREDGLDQLLVPPDAVDPAVLGRYPPPVFLISTKSLCAPPVSCWDRKPGRDEAGRDEIGRDLRPDWCWRSWW